MENKQIISTEINASSIEDILDKAFSSKAEEKSFCFSVIDQFLKQLIFDPTECLVLALSKISSVGDIGILNICFNNGAKQNSYVKTSRGKVHFLIYAAQNIDSSLIKIVLFVMIMKGCNPLKPALKTDGTIVSENVKDYLQTYYRIDIPSVASECQNNIELLEEDEKEILNIYFGLLDEYFKKDIKLMCCFRVAFFDRIKEDINTSSCFKIAFECAFKELFFQILNSGNIPSYADICYFISHYSRISKIPLMQLTCELFKEILLELVKRGVEFDGFQINELESIDPVFKLIMEEMYKAPIWEKISYNTSDKIIKDEYRELSILLGQSQNSSKKKIANFFREIASSDTSVLINSYRVRNINRVSLNISEIFENISTYLDVESKVDPFDYPLIFSIFYKESSKIFCFMFNSFESILKDGLNPYNNKKLPETLLIKIKYRLSILKHFKIKNSKCVTFAKLIERIKEPTVLKTTEIESLEAIYSETLESKGYTSHNISNCSIKTLSDKLLEVGIYIEEYISLGHKENMNELPLSERFMYIILIKAISKKFETDKSVLERLRTL